MASLPMFGKATTPLSIVFWAKYSLNVSRSGIEAGDRLAVDCPRGVRLIIANSNSRSSNSSDSGGVSQTYDLCVTLLKTAQKKSVKSLSCCQRCRTSRYPRFRSSALLRRVYISAVPSLDLAELTE